MAMRDVPNLLIYSTAAAVLAGSVALSLVLTRAPASPRRKIIESPRTTLLPQLSPAQAKSLGYPPDALPGSRDVGTPYGSMRVYEWGPSDGRKVLMVHGDATPSPLFRPMAQELVNRGCRVLTFDLWGRGYSDTPLDDPHTGKLYMQQILYALLSSPLQWTGPDNRFSLIGFSMGGAIAVNFFADHPTMIESLVLLAPAGLLPTLPPEYTSFFFHHSGLASKSKMRMLIGTLLGVDMTKSPEEPVEAVETPAGFSPAGALQFQFDYHQGHVQSLQSNIQYGPIQYQHQTWRRALEVVCGKTKQDTPLCNGKILVICGQDDTVILSKNVHDDLEGFLGEEGKHWEFDTFPGNHNFPWPEGANVGNRIADFWKLA